MTDDGTDTGTGDESGRVAAPSTVDADEAASPEEVEALMREYEASGRPFARVTVVRREPPVSATVGDRAMVTPEGDLVGWVGGAGCAQSVAVKEATAALADGEPRLVGLAPDPEAVDRPGLVSYPMTCHSGGTLELFVEPVRPAPRLVVVGDSTVATTLVRLAGELSYEVTAATERGDPVAGADETVAATDADALAAAMAGARFVVVASIGAYDGVGVEAALRADVPYVGLVASDTRRDELAATVADRLDADPGAVADAVTTPAGLDVGAETPEEIAVGILAELVAVRRGVAGPVAVDVGDPSGVDATTDASDGGAADGTSGADETNGTNETGRTDGDHDNGHGDRTSDDPDVETVVDPVCGMDVVVPEAAATVDHGGETYHFCGEGCAEAFAADPDRYLGPDANEEVVAGE